jgi:hypothetical protein
MEYNTFFFAHGQVWIFLFGMYIYERDINHWIRFGQFIPFWHIPISLFSIIALGICLASGLILVTEVTTLRRSPELTKTLFFIAFFLFILQVIVIIVSVEFYVGISLLQATSIFPLPITFLIALLLLRHKGFRFMRKSYFQGFLMIVSCLMFPFAIVGMYSNSLVLYFPIGVCSIFFHNNLVEWGRFNMLFYLGRFFPEFIIFAGIWMVVGLILTAETIKLWGGKELTKKAFSMFILLLTFEIVYPIILVLLTYSGYLENINYIVPLPIPFLMAILLLKRRGVTLMPFKNIRGL